MAEAAAPAVKATTEDKPGMAYYNKLRADLRDSIAKKRKLDKDLRETEEAIYTMETAYLEEASAGNIIKGFDNYIKNSTGTSLGGAGTGTSTRRKGGITEADRIFSRSSVAFLRSQDSPGVSSDAALSGAPTPASSLIAQSARESTQPTPGGTNIGKAPATKKKKAAGKEEEGGEGKTARRGKITYARE